MTDYKEPIYESRFKRTWKLYKVYEEEVKAERRIKANASEINEIMDNAIEKMSECHSDSSLAYIDSHRLDEYINKLIDIREKVNKLASSAKRVPTDDNHSYKNVDLEVEKDLEQAKLLESKLLKLIKHS